MENRPEHEKSEPPRPALFCAQNFQRDRQQPADERGTAQINGTIGRHPGQLGSTGHTGGRVCLPDRRAGGGRGGELGTPSPAGRVCLPERRPGDGPGPGRLSSNRGRALQFVAAVLQNGRGGEFYAHGKKFITSLSLYPPISPPRPCKPRPAILQKPAIFAAPFDHSGHFADFWGIIGGIYRPGIYT